jgi:hypothetical protein
MNLTRSGKEREITMMPVGLAVGVVAGLSFALLSR